MGEDCAASGRQTANMGEFAGLLTSLQELLVLHNQAFATVVEPYMNAIAPSRPRLSSYADYEGLLDGARCVGDKMTSIEMNMMAMSNITREAWFSRKDAWRDSWHDKARSVLTTFGFAVNGSSAMSQLYHALDDKRKQVEQRYNRVRDEAVRAGTGEGMALLEATDMYNALCVQSYAEYFGARHPNKMTSWRLIAVLRAIEAHLLGAQSTDEGVPGGHLKALKQCLLNDEVSSILRLPELVYDYNLRSRGATVPVRGSGGLWNLEPGTAEPRGHPYYTVKRRSKLYYT